MRVNEVHLALVALLVVVDQSHYGFDTQTDTRHADKVALVVVYTVVDEDRKFVLVGHVQVDVDFVGRLHYQHTKVPGIARFLRVDLLEHTLFRLVVVAAGAGDEIGGVSVVLGHDLIEVTGDLRRVTLASQRPVTQKGVVGHHRGNQDRSH
ncbi:hypothetical protein D3C77_622980 [compost metagenome]